MHEIHTLLPDLNLLCALDMLLREQSVSRAAQRSGITQSAMSHSLARLRDALGDPILVREGRTMKLTASAEQMQKPLQNLLGALDHLLRDVGQFDPVTSSRIFHVSWPGFFSSSLPSLVERLHEEGPNVGVEAETPLRDDPVGQLASGRIDAAVVAVLPPGASVRRVALPAMPWGVFARRGHPLAKKRMTARDWVSYPHIQVRYRDRSPGPIDRLLQEHSLARDVSLVVPDFHSAPLIVAQSDYLLTALAPPLRRDAKRLRLECLKPPIDLEPVQLSVLWHEWQADDPAHRWFREHLVDALREACSS
jgi:DNA-binding transcriptional LysR family regulator